LFNEEHVIVFENNSHICSWILFTELVSSCKNDVMSYILHLWPQKWSISDKKSSYFPTQIKLIFRQKVLTDYPNLLQIHINGLVKRSKDASARNILSYSLNICKRLPNRSFILTAEVKAITEELKVVKEKPP